MSATPAPTGACCLLRRVYCWACLRQIPAHTLVEARRCVEGPLHNWIYYCTDDHSERRHRHYD